MPKNQWSNRLSFILTSAAFAIGLGNIWRFPYITGENGGGAFLLVYIALIFLFGIPLLLSEMALGNLSRSSPIRGFGKLSGKNAWNLIGWMKILATTLIMTYYVMIMAWIAIYAIDSLNGTFTSMDSQAISTHFTSTCAQIPKVIAIVFIIMVLAGLSIKQGIAKGLERYSKSLLIALLILIIVLAIWAATLPGASEGYKWYLNPDFSKINLAVVISALGQLFFSIGVGMGVAFVFGSFARKGENLVSATTWIVMMDTFVALLAGFMIFPILFTFDLAPDSGPNLIFLTMARAFGSMELGSVIGFVFFVLLFIGGFTSLISAVQGVKASIEERFNLKPINALYIVLGVIFLGSVPVIFSYTENPITFLAGTIFDNLDYLTNSVMLPINGILIAIFISYVLGFSKLTDHLSLGSGALKMKTFWKLMMMFVIPISLLILLFSGL